MITTCFKSVGWSLLVLGSYRSASRTHQLQVSRCVRLQPTMGRKLEEFLEFRLPMRLLLTVGHATYIFVFLLKPSGRAGHLYIHVILISICVLTVSICLCFTLAYHGGVFPLTAIQILLVFHNWTLWRPAKSSKKTSNKNHQRDYTVQSEFHDTIALYTLARPEASFPPSISRPCRSCLRS